MFGVYFILKQPVKLLLINKRLWKEEEEFRAVVIIMIALFLAGTIFYTFFEKWSMINTIYFCVMTIATIGYGDFAPTTTLSKIFTIIMALGGVGVFLGIATKLARELTKKSIEKKS